MLNIQKVTRVFVSDVGAKEGFSCIVFQWLAVADEGKLALDLPPATAVDYSGRS